MMMTSNESQPPSKIKNNFKSVFPSSPPDSDDLSSSKSMSPVPTTTEIICPKDVQDMGLIYEKKELDDEEDCSQKQNHLNDCEEEYSHEELPFTPSTDESNIDGHSQSSRRESLSDLHDHHSHERIQHESERKRHDSDLSFGDIHSDLYYEDDSEDRNCLHQEDVFRDPELYSNRLHELEQEQEQLNSSLIALTSHFAQVQLRLKQIVDASAEEKEKLLKELEEFAFRGIPDTSLDVINDLTCNSNIPSHDTSNENGNGSLEGSEEPSKLEQQRKKQKELMGKLKCQLEDLEKYAYETGDFNGIPSSMLIERQTVIIEQLKGKLALNLDDMDRLTPEELRKQVDQALRDLINPVIMKEQLVEQLKTQVSDLERYIQHLQRSLETHDKIMSSKCKHSSSDGQCTCDCPLHGNSQTGLQPYDEIIAAERLSGIKRGCSTNNSSPGSFKDTHREDSEEAIKMIKRVMTLLQMITFAQFGCNRGIKRFERNTLKKTTRGSHWGDLRARLEIIVDKIIQINKEKFTNDSDYTSDSGDEAVFSPANERMTSVVRKEFAPALRDLMEHGLCSEDGVSSSASSLIVSSLFDWGCFSARSSAVSSSRDDSFSSSSRRTLTAWDLILKYYNLKVRNQERTSQACILFITEIALFHRMENPFHLLLPEGYLRVLT